VKEGVKEYMNAEEEFNELERRLQKIGGRKVSLRKIDEKKISEKIRLIQTESVNNPLFSYEYLRGYFECLLDIILGKFDFEGGKNEGKNCCG